MGQKSRAEMISESLSEIVLTGSNEPQSYLMIFVPISPSTSRGKGWPIPSQIPAPMTTLRRRCAIRAS